MATDLMSPTTQAENDPRYDGVAIALHWLTALLVVALFAMAQIWGFLPRGGAARHTLQSLHVSLGVTLAAVLAARLLWRLGFGRRMPAVGGVWTERAAEVMHVALYGLLVVMVVAGFAKRWVDDKGAGFFGLFDVPPPFEIDDAWYPAIKAIHLYGAWTIIVLAGLHAAAALFHHYFLRDGVLRRMLPASPAAPPPASGSRVA